MSVTRCSHLVLVVLAAAVCGTLSAQTPVASGDRSTGAADAAHPKAVYPQIVRLSLVEGDVRVALGKQKGLHGVSPWVQAAVNMPLETGFSLVTGKGRAEIEFEDASTMYLGENSVLAFNDLSTKDGVPLSKLELLTGVATLHWLPTVPGEEYYLEMPTDSLHIPFGRRADLRINSYLNAMTITPQGPYTIQSGRSQLQPGVTGRTFTFKNGRFEVVPQGATNNFAEWDKWVAARETARTQAMEAVMKEAGLKEPLPGLADMEAKGRFFACEPYGTCWEPNKGWDSGPAAAGAQQVPVAQQVSATQDSAQPQVSAAQQAKLAQEAQRDEEDAEAQTEGGVAPAVWTEDEDDFPCSPYDVEDLMTQDPVTGEDLVLASDVEWDGDFYDDDYDWAVCHAGSWLYRQHRYVWVVGRRRHHRRPVRWVKMAGKRGYVPIHPRDVAGRLPVNLRHGMFVPAERKGGGVERVAFDAGARVKVLEETPREFRQPPLPVLRAAAAPTVEAHQMMAALPGGKASAAPPVSLIAFDRKAGFTITTRVNEGGRSQTFVDHFSGGVGRAGGSGLRGGYGGGTASGGGRSGYSGGGSSGGGGARAAGGGSMSSGSVSSGASAAASSGGGHSH